MLIADVNYNIKYFCKSVDVKTVSELLSHADTGVTYNIYIHLIQEQKVKAIEGLEKL